ncbi:MAG: peptide chain release factor N(5)-glutamine methyltransferase [Patescibacteria group bacterium]
MIDSLDRELILSYILHKPREYLLAHPEPRLNFLERLRLRRLLRQRAHGVPLAYLTGHKEFYGLDFFVNKHVLIPRPETELMIKLALQKILDSRFEIPISILIDIGTGTGCIPIAIIKTLKHKNIKTFAIDISRQALKVAKKNAKHHNVPITFLHGNLLEPIIKDHKLTAMGHKLIITANLPYLTQEQYTQEPSIHHEPKSALIAPYGGLALYEQFLQQLQKLLKAYGCQLTAFLEIDPSQSPRITSLIKKYLPNAKIAIKKDLASRDRCVVVST